MFVNPPLRLNFKGVYKENLTGFERQDLHIENYTGIKKIWRETQTRVLDVFL